MFKASITHAHVNTYLCVGSEVIKSLTQDVNSGERAWSEESQDKSRCNDGVDVRQPGRPESNQGKHS